MLFRLILILLFLLPFAPALAQDTVGEEDILEVNCNLPESEVAKDFCLTKEYKAMERRLSKTYKQALYRLHDDNELNKMQAFQNSQHAWSEYRDLACRAEQYEAYVQSKTELYARNCYLRLAARRIMDIQNHFKTWD
jgi:uncharacterized protein YecT (DUF1311 family)